MEYPKFKVCVRCFTFNQSQYITNTMDGFCMQKTNFPFVCCIVDDASTDGEQKVIREYMDSHFDLQDNSVAYEKETDYANIFFARNKKSPNCYFAVLLLKKNHWGKKSKIPYLTEWRNICDYEAVCEGDDYWIDDEKLQKQATFLDKENKFGLVFTDYEIIDTENKVYQEEKIPALYKYMKQNISDGLVFGKLFNNPSGVMTCTIMYRMCYNKNYIIDHDRIMDISSQSYIKYFKDKTAMYRINPLGMMRSQKDTVNSLLFQTISLKMIEFYEGKYDNNLYKKAIIIKQVRLFFSKYFTAWIRGYNHASFSIIKKCFSCDPVLLITTPWYIFCRLTKIFK